MVLQLTGRTVQAVEARAMKGVDPHYGTRGKRRNLIRLAVQHGKVCAHCNNPVFFIWEKDTNPKYNKRRMATFDHIILKKKGGTYKLENGLLSCYGCNNLRGDMEIEVFRKKIASGIGKTISERNERRHQKRLARKREVEKSPERKLFILKLALVIHFIKMQESKCKKN